MNTMTSLAPLLESFFTQRLHQQPSRLDFKQVDAPLVVEFLNELENHRGLSTRSRNL